MFNNDNFKRHTVTCPTTYRKVHRVTKLTDAKTGEVSTGFVTVDEMVAQHDIYREVDGKRVLTQLWWRGAKVS